MQNESELQEQLSPNLEAQQLTAGQDKKDGEGGEVVSELQPTADDVKASKPASRKTPRFPKPDEGRYADLLEEAVKRGHLSTSQPAPQAPPRLWVGNGKWQSTLVTLTAEGAAGDAACHFFNSDLWRYGGLVSLQQNPSWHEADSIDLRLSHEQVEVGLHEAQTGRSITWSWCLDETGVFRVQPEHIHVLEFVCGYLNQAVGASVHQPVIHSFALPHSSECLYVGGIWPRIYRPTRPFVEALTRARGEPLMIPLDSDEKSDRGNCLATESSESFLTEDTVVQLPSAWSACDGSPCLCGNSVMVLDTTQEPLQVRELESGEDYLAISYVWAQHDLFSLLWHIERATEVIGVSLVWLDRLCINQRCYQHKARQIPLMREVYQKGYATVALVPDVTEILPTVFHTPTEILSRRDFGAVVNRFKDRMRSCKWRTRCWTYQEGLLGRRGYYVTQKQVLPARIVSDAMVELGNGDKRQRGIGTELMDSLEVRSIRCQIQTWCQKLTSGDLLDAEDYDLMQF